MNHILVDIDGTLANCQWRENKIATEGWDGFHRAAMDDEPILSVALMIRTLHRDFHIVGNTGRPEKWRTPTLTWCYQKKIDLDDLLMRPNRDFRKAPEVKFDQALAHFGGEDHLRQKVALVIDDHVGVLEKFMGIGINVLLVNPKGMKVDPTAA